MWSLLVAVAATIALLQPGTAAFESPGFSNVGGGQTNASHDNKEPVTANSYFDKEQITKYSGPVFVIREVISDGDDGSSRLTYDAFVTTGDIEEVKRPVSSAKSATKANRPTKPSNNGTTVAGHKKTSNNSTASATGHKKPSNNSTTTVVGHKKPSNNSTTTVVGHKKKKPSDNSTVTAASEKEKPSDNGAVTAATVQKQRPDDTAATDKPVAAGEDPNLFGVLITHQSAAQLKFPGSLRVNVSLSVLFEVTASRMPWMLVLRRNNSIQFSAYRATPAPPEAAAARQRRLAADFLDENVAREFVVQYRPSAAAQRERSDDDVVVSAVSAAGGYSHRRAQERNGRKTLRPPN